MTQVETTTMSEKGQVVIPRRIRKTLKIKPRTRFAVYAKKNTIVMKAHELPDLEKEWSRIFEVADKKSLTLGEKDVYAEVQAHSARKKRQKQS